MSTTEKQYLPGFELIHEGLIDFYTTTATTPEEAVQDVKSSILTGHLVYDGMGFRVYRRVQRPESVLWDLEEVGMYRYREGE